MNLLCLSIRINDEYRQLTITPQMVETAQPILDKMDQDMARGWQLGKYFILAPDRKQRCQIVSNRLLTALHTDNQSSMTLMATYLVSRLPNISTVDINGEGEVEETRFFDHEGCPIP